MYISSQLYSHPLVSKRIVPGPAAEICCHQNLKSLRFHSWLFVSAVLYLQIQVAVDHVVFIEKIPLWVVPCSSNPYFSKVKCISVYVMEIQAYICIHTHKHIHPCIYKDLYFIFVFMCVCIYIHTFYIYIYISVYMYFFICVFLNEFILIFYF